VPEVAEQLRETFCNQNKKFGTRTRLKGMSILNKSREFERYMGENVPRMFRPIMCVARDNDEAR